MQRVKIAITIVFIGLIVYSLYVTYMWGYQVIMFNLLNTKVRMYDEMELEILEDIKVGKIKEAKEKIEYIKNYYPAGTCFQNEPQFEWLHERIREEFLFHLNSELTSKYENKQHIDIINKQRLDLLIEEMKSGKPYKITPIIWSDKEGDNVNDESPKRAILESERSDSP